jgi:predicted RNase H-like HicB family nuclease
MKMAKKVGINFSKLNGDLEVFEHEDLDALLDIPDNEESILEECKKYDLVEYPIKLRQVISNNKKIWIAEHPDLPGCITHGNTKAEALLNLEDAKQAWIYDCIVDGKTVPDPEVTKEIEEFSGKFVVRLPRELHSKITKMAESNYASLNQQILYMLSVALGEEKTNEVFNKLLDGIEDIQAKLTNETNLQFSSGYLRTLERLKGGFIDRAVKQTQDVGNKDYFTKKRFSIKPCLFAVPKYDN